MASLLDDLKREIAGAAKPLIVCGAGVSKAANPKAPDWRALIESGIVLADQIAWLPMEHGSAKRLRANPLSGSALPIRSPTNSAAGSIPSFGSG